MQQCCYSEVGMVFRRRNQHVFNFHQCFGKAIYTTSNCQCICTCSIDVCQLNIYMQYRQVSVLYHCYRYGVSGDNSQYIDNYLEKKTAVCFFGSYWYHYDSENKMEIFNIFMYMPTIVRLFHDSFFHIRVRMRLLLTTTTKQLKNLLSNRSNFNPSETIFELI